MGSTKRYFYSDNQLNVANSFKALGHPARVKIIELLLLNNELNVIEISSRIPLAQATLSKHLKLLFDYGIIGYQVVNSSSFYTLNSNHLSEIMNYLLDLRSLSGNIQIDYSQVYFKPAPEILPMNTQPKMR